MHRVFSITWPVVILGKWDIILKKFLNKLKSQEICSLGIIPNSDMASISFLGAKWERNGIFRCRRSWGCHYNRQSNRWKSRQNHRSKQTLSSKPGSKATTLTRQVISLRLAEISCQVIPMEARSCRYYKIKKSSGWNSFFHKMHTTSIVISVLPDLSAAQQVNSYNKFQDDRLS